MSNKVTVKGYEPGMVIQENSYIYMGLSKDNDLEVVFYTPYEIKSNKDVEPPLDFESFYQIIVDERFPYSKIADGAQYSESDSIKTGVYAKVRNYEHSEVDVVLFEVRENPISVNLMLDGKLNTDLILKRLMAISNSIKEDELIAHKESLDFKKDTYGYYGMKRSNF